MNRLALGAIAIALGASFFISPAWLESHVPTLCLWHRWLDAPCPSCGLTRGLCAISHGDFGLAWSYHKLSFLIYALALLVIVQGLRTLISRK